LSLSSEVIIGKKFTVYLPKEIVKAMGFREGERIVLRVVGNTVIMEKVGDPIELAISGPKFASLKPKEIEAISNEEQRKYAEDSA